MYFKTKIKDLLSLGSTNFLVSLIGGLFWLYIAKILDKTEYGEIGYLISFATFAGGLCIMGFGTLIVVYEPKKENVFPSSYVIVVIASAIAAVIAFIFTQNIIVSFLVMGMASFEIILQGILAKKQYKKFSKNNLLRQLVSVGLAIFFFQIWGINGILFGYFLGTLIAFAELYPLLKNKKIEYSILRPKIRFILETFSLKISRIVYRSGDKLLIGALFGFTLLGSYFFAAQYLLLLLNFPKTITQYLLPQEAEGKKNNKFKLVSILVACLVALISIVAISYAIDIFFPKFTETILPIQIMSISIIPLTISQIQIIEYLAKGNSRIVLIANIFQVTLYFSLIIGLGESFGLMGLAFAFLIPASLKPIFILIMKSRISTKLMK